LTFFDKNEHNNQVESKIELTKTDASVTQV
jgi:hypothetical protein